jgi:hypothetical protein
MPTICTSQQPVHRSYFSYASVTSFVLGSYLVFTMLCLKLPGAFVSAPSINKLPCARSTVSDSSSLFSRSRRTAPKEIVSTDDPSTKSRSLSLHVTQAKQIYISNSTAAAEPHIISSRLSLTDEARCSRSQPCTCCRHSASYAVQSRAPMHRESSAASASTASLQGTTFHHIDTGGTTRLHQRRRRSPYR